jgi:hypothetical protein
MSLRIDENDLSLFPKSFQAQARRTLKKMGVDDRFPTEKKRRDNPEDRLVVQPTTELCDQLGVWWVHIPPSHVVKADGQIVHITAYKGRKGLTDLIMGYQGRSVFLECKAPGKKPTADQLEAMNALGGWWTDNPIGAENVVYWLIGKRPMFQVDANRKVSV